MKPHGRTAPGQRPVPPEQRDHTHYKTEPSPKGAANHHNPALLKNRRKFAARSPACTAIPTDFADAHYFVVDSGPAALPLEVTAAQFHRKAVAECNEASAHLVRKRAGVVAGVAIRLPVVCVREQLAGVFEDRRRFQRRALALQQRWLTVGRRDAGYGLLSVLFERPDQPLVERNSGVTHGDPRPE